MKMKGIAKVASATLLAFAFSMPAISADVVIKLGHIAESSNPYGMGADYFADLVKKKSNGSIEVKVFPPPVGKTNIVPM